MTKLFLAALSMIALYSCSTIDDKHSQKKENVDTTNQTFGDSKIDSNDIKLLRDQLK